jgi:Flp pilus assembly pilin Flp
MIGMPRWIESFLTRVRVDHGDMRLRTPANISRSRRAAQGLVEYGILIAVVAVIALASVQTFGGGVGALFGRLLARFAGLG